MLLVSKPPTSRNLVELEGTEGSAIFTWCWCVAWSDVGDVVWICMKLVNHGLGYWHGSVG